MRTRDFITHLGVLLAGWPFVVRTEQQPRLLRVGYSGILPAGAPHYAAFEKRIPSSAISNGVASSPDEITDFMATPQGVALAKAFMRIGNAHLRRRIVDLVEQIVNRQLH